MNEYTPGLSLIWPGSVERGTTRVSLLTLPLVPEDNSRDDLVLELVIVATDCQLVWVLTEDLHLQLPWQLMFSVPESPHSLLHIAESCLIRTGLLNAQSWHKGPREASSSTDWGWGWDSQLWVWWRGLSHSSSYTRYTVCTKDMGYRFVDLQIYSKSEQTWGNGGGCRKQPTNPCSFSDLQICKNNHYWYWQEGRGV